MSQYAQVLRKSPWYKRVTVALFGALALAPLFFMLPEILTGSFHKIAISNADTLGTGTFLIFLAMLTITPLITITGKRWFAPLRWWYGVTFFATAAVEC